MAEPISLMDAAKAMPPLQQGAFDNLCGLYSAINAIRLCLWANKGLRLHRPRRLFDWGIDQIEKNLGVVSVLHEGMDIEQWQWLTDRLVLKASKWAGVDVQRHFLNDGTSRTSYRKFLRELSLKGSHLQPILFHVSGAMDHYSVCIGLTDHRILLYDSHPRKWLRHDRCGLNSSNFRYSIDRRSVSYLSVGL